jgi:hypothetical protein
MAKKFLTSIDLSKCELINASIHNLATAPSAPANGQVYFDTSDAQMYFYNGSSWQAMGGDISSVEITAGAAMSGSLSVTRGAFSTTLDVNTDGTTIAVNGEDSLYIVKDSEYLETFYNTSGSLTSARTVTLGAHNLTFDATGTGSVTIEKDLYLGTAGSTTGTLHLGATSDGSSSQILFEDGTAPIGEIRFAHNVGDFQFRISDSTFLQIDGTAGNAGIKVNKGSLISSEFALDVTGNDGAAGPARLEGMLETTTESKLVTITDAGVLEYRVLTGLGEDGTLKNIGTHDLSATAARTLSVLDNTASAFAIKEGSNSILDLTTTDGSEKITLGYSTEVGGNLTVNGNLTVVGSQTNVSVESTTVQLGDSYLSLNSGWDRGLDAVNDAGWVVIRGAEQGNVSVVWKEEERKFYLANVGDEDGVTDPANVGIVDTVALHVGALTADDAAVISGSLSIGTIAEDNASSIMGIDGNGLVTTVSTSSIVAGGMTFKYSDDEGSATALASTSELTINAGEGLTASGSGSTITLEGEDATASNKGIVELATNTETNAMADTARAVTPAGLAKLRFTDVVPGGATTVPIGHGLNSLFCIVQVMELATGATVECDVRRVDPDHVELDFCVAPEEGALQVMVMKVA